MSTITETNETAGARASSRAALGVMLTDAAIEQPSAGRIVDDAGLSARTDRRARSMAPGIYVLAA